jgi:dTDP-glucose pyrophosphorylase
MKQIDQTGRQMLLVTEGTKLRAIITDGDIRRHILHGGELSTSIKEVSNYSPHYIFEQDKADAKAIMKQWSILSLPVLNDELEVQSIIFANEYEIGRSRSVGIPVVIMAGGEGSRLYPYTQILPKPLIPVGEIPVTEHIINQFQDYDCHDIHMIVNYKKNMIKAYFNELEKDYRVYFHDEDKPLGTGGGLSLLKGKINETFFFSNCDILIKANYKEIYDFHRENGNLITVVAAVKHIVIPYGVIAMGDQGEIAAMTEKPQYSFLTNTGFYIVEPGLLDELQDDTPIGFPDVIEQARSQNKRIGVFPVGEKSWLDMGQMEELERMRKEMGV